MVAKKYVYKNTGWLNKNGKHRDFKRRFKTRAGIKLKQLNEVKKADLEETYTQNSIEKEVQGLVRDLFNEVELSKDYLTLDRIALAIGKSKAKASRLMSGAGFVFKRGSNEVKIREGVTTESICDYLIDNTTTRELLGLSLLRYELKDKERNAEYVNKRQTFPNGYKIRQREDAKKATNQAKQASKRERIFK